MNFKLLFLITLLLFLPGVQGLDLTDAEQTAITNLCEGSNLSYSNCGTFEGILEKINENDYQTDFNTFKTQYENDLDDLEENFDDFKKDQQNEIDKVLDNQDDNYKSIRDLERNMSKKFLDLENNFDKKFDDLKDHVDDQDKKIESKITASNSTQTTIQNSGSFDLAGIPKMKFETQQYAKLDKYVDEALYGDGTSQQTTINQVQQTPGIDLTAYALKQDLPFWNFIFIWIFIFILISGLILTNVYFYFKLKEYEIPEEVKKAWSKKIKLNSVNTEKQT